MKTNEQIVVSLTSWPPRFPNLTAVLDTIFNQTLPPDKVVLNLAFGDELPESVNDYLEQHNVEIFRVPDTKVYKKLIPTLRRYPDACVISIDDDWLYPKGMVEEFVELHSLYPNYPISGNHAVIRGLQCHCGCASLTKAEFFGKYLNVFDNELFANCKSDDIAYTYFCAKNGLPYIRTANEYFDNLTGFEAIEPYSCGDIEGAIQESFQYLISQYGPVDDYISLIVNDTYLAEILRQIEMKQLSDLDHQIRNTFSYRFGNFFAKHISGFLQIFKKGCP